nr:hypothetical protein L204_04277 [Cryptococcus depauperatus CBS 7855]
MTQSFPRPLPASSSSQSLHHSSLPATTSKPHRPPQSSLSVQLFQQRHAEEFPHLYKHHNPEEHEALIKTESQTLEEARRIGRIMRESMIRPSSNNGPPSQTIHKGRRPLSLVMNGSTGQPHIDNMDHGLAVSPLSTAKVSVLPSKESLDYFAPYLSTQISSSSYSSKTQIITPGQSHLNLGFGSQSHAPASLPEEPSCSSADTSLQHSTYSWASSFSGETEELRLAAHYIPSQSQEDIPPSEEEILGIPEKTNRRRKRIVAIAHTARQLEGVGSRDAEDPSFYPMLIKAWNDRYGIVPQKDFQSHNKAESNSESPNAKSITAIYANPGAWFAAGPSLNSKINQQVRPNVSSDPLLDSTAQSSSHARYSFASSAHDLVEDGGMERGAQILSEKAWLRTPLRSHEAFFGAQSQPAPFPLSHKEPISHHTDGSNFSNDLTTEEDTKHAWANHHGKKLRRVQTDITNIKKARGSWSLLHELPNFPQPRPIGLGFVGNQPIFSDRNPTIHKEQKQDFQHGEDRICIKETKKGTERCQSFHFHNQDCVPLQTPIDKEEEPTETINLTLGASGPVSFHPTAERERKHQGQFETFIRPESEEVGYQHLNLSQRPGCWTLLTTYVPQHTKHQLGTPIEFVLPEKLSKPVSACSVKAVEMTRQETTKVEKSKKGEWVEDLGSCHSSEIYLSPLRFLANHRQNHRPVLQNSSQYHCQDNVPMMQASLLTQYGKTREGPVFPAMLNTSATIEEERMMMAQELKDGNLGSTRIKDQSYDLYCFQNMSAEVGWLSTEAEGTKTTVDNIEKRAFDQRLIYQTKRLSELQRQLSQEPPTITPVAYDSEKATHSQSLPKLSQTPLVFFIFGFFLPILWFIGGWLLPTRYDIDHAFKHQLHSKCLYHPDSRILACRYASIVFLSLLLIIGIILAIFLPLSH